MTFFCHNSSVIDENVKIGKGTKIWHFSHISKYAEIGTKCTIGQNVYIGPNVKIGNNVKIQNNVSVYEGVELEDFVFLGPSVVFTNVINPRSQFEKKDLFKPTIIKKNVSIGANATIVCGITIQEYAFLGAGSLLTKNINPYELWYGNPAQKKGWVDEYGVVITENVKKNKIFKSKSGQIFKLSENNNLIKSS